MRAYTVPVPKRRPDRERDSKLPTRDDVAAELEATPDQGRPEHPELEVVSFRPAMRDSAVRVAPTLLIVGMVLCVPFAIGTPMGQQLADERGVLGLGATWFAMVVIIIVGALLAIATSRGIANPVRRATRTDTLKLALGDSAFAAAGATLASVIIMSINFIDMVSIIGIVFAMTFLFSWAMLFPLYRQSWDDAYGRDDEDDADGALPGPSER